MSLNVERPSRRGADRNPKYKRTGTHLKESILNRKENFPKTSRKQSVKNDENFFQKKYKRVLIPSLAQWSLSTLVTTTAYRPTYLCGVIRVWSWWREVHNTSWRLSKVWSSSRISLQCRLLLACVTRVTPQMWCQSDITMLPPEPPGPTHSNLTETLPPVLNPLTSPSVWLSRHRPSTLVQPIQTGDTTAVRWPQRPLFPLSPYQSPPMSNGTGPVPVSKVRLLRKLN